MGAHSSITFTREQAINRFVQESLKKETEKLERQLRSKAHLFTNDELESELDVLLDEQLYNAVIRS